MNANPEEWLPFIDMAVCTSCGECVVACPTDAMALEGGLVTIDGERCGYCAVCEAVCPTEAIALPYQVVMAEGAD